MQCLDHLIQTDSWNDLNHLPGKFQDANITELQAFQHVKEELTVGNKKKKYS